MPDNGKAFVVTVQCRSVRRSCAGRDLELRLARFLLAQERRAFLPWGIPSTLNCYPLCSFVEMIATLIVSGTAQAQTSITVEFESENYSTDEPDVPGEISQFEVGVILNQASNNPVTVNYATSSVTAKPFEDYHDTSGTLTFPPNTTRQVFFVEILGDDLLENLNRFRLNLSSPTGATLGTIQGSQIVITDADEPATIWIEDIDPVNEGPNAEINLVFHRTKAADFAYSPILQAQPVEAQQGQDYVHYNTAVEIPPYVLTHVAPIPIQIINDNKKEPPERLYIDYVDNETDEWAKELPQGNDQYVWIIDDDTPPGIKVTTSDITHSVRKRHLQVPEGGNKQYQIWLTQPPTEDVTIGTELWGQDQDITLDAPRRHTFTPDNWYEPYWITVNAAQDDDTLDGYRRINHTIETDDPFYQGHHPRWITAQEMDDDPDDSWVTTSEPVSGVVNGITASFEYTPKRHDWDPFLIRIKFSERVTTSYRKMRDHALSVTTGEVLRAYRTSGKSDDWTFEIGVHQGENPMTITLEGGRACNQQGAVCAPGGKRLANTLTLTLQAPE